MSNDFLIWLAEMGMCILLFPIFVYFTMKYGTLGFLAAKRHFRKFHNKRKDHERGNTTTEDGTRDSLR